MTLRLALSALILALAMPGCTTLSTSPAPVAADAANVARFREMAAAWHAKDWRKVADLFAPNGVLHSVMIEPVVGREQIYQRIASMGAGIDAITLDVGHLGVIDGRVYVERVDRFTYHGKAGAIPVVGVLTYKDGLIAEWLEYYDRASLLREMGEGKAAN